MGSTTCCEVDSKFEAKDRESSAPREFPFFSERSSRLGVKFPSEPERVLLTGVLAFLPAVLLLLLRLTLERR